VHILKKSFSFPSILIIWKRQVFCVFWYFHRTPTFLPARVAFDYVIVFIKMWLEFPRFGVSHFLLVFEKVYILKLFCFTVSVTTWKASEFIFPCYAMARRSTKNCVREDSNALLVRFRCKIASWILQKYSKPFIKQFRVFLWIKNQEFNISWLRLAIYLWIGQPNN
jgi:hypothetical protein